VQQPWWEPQQVKDAVGWSAARAVFDDELVDVKLIRMGERSVGADVGGAVEIFVIGATPDGDLVGFNVLSVET
jgi:hypothetical protein